MCAYYLKRKLGQKHVKAFALTSAIAIFVVSLSGCSQHQEGTQDDNTIKQAQNSPPHAVFYQQTMLAIPPLPANQSDKSEGCSLRPANDAYKTSTQVNYADYGWESRITLQPNYFDISSQSGRVFVIDMADKNGEMAYRYLGNDNSHDEIYEPWSSSKIFAYTGAISKVRELGLGAQATIGETYIADMITGINSYEDFGTASGESNALATFFANVAGRERLTGLFYDQWLKLSNPNIYFKGAYGPVAFEPSNLIWSMLNTEKSALITPYLEASEDPAYLPYRCDTCGLTGNKPMTTLAQAEWLKRLAVHQRDRATAHPNLLAQDVETLLYGTGHSYPDQRFAGMTLGISTMLQQAIANVMVDGQSNDVKKTLDEQTQGQWRVFQKIGWGPSETRSTTENVVLAHVCLPHFQGGREFTIAAQVAVPQAKEENLPLAGKKMLALLEDSMRTLLREP
ncbi:hypothetical protein KJ365_15230 [Glaciecola sp. XM2]|uniref:hypothetical protein n=1 Tax=Glaciecola sp. XM2 TaxID=1914931 RepID=UPI001BDF57A1|nr:hypothetical protein [Glaciecola sp. XM2]MBT1452238.1 hypothetical protein [Glaciecola sp. XM2]